MNRRKALKLLGAAGVVGVSYTAVRGIEGAYALGRNQLVTRMLTGMGTFVSVTVADPSRQRAEDAIGTAFELMDRKEKILSRFLPGSALSVLNDAGKLEGPPTDLVQVLRRSGEAYEKTQGAFDVTVAPILALYGTSFSNGAQPQISAIDDRLDLVGFNKMSIADNRVAFSRSGMSVTLDGVAKGWIVDAMAKQLKGMGVKHGLINAGGDIRAFGGKDTGKPWKIAVREPNNAQKFAAKYDIMDGACATSGDYEVHFDKEKLFHHIVVPKTGLSPREFASATVLAKDTTNADALSTSLLVLGRTGTDIVRRNSRGILLVSDKGEQLAG